MTISHTPSPSATSRPQPYVMSDTGPDGLPQALLVTPTPETVLDRDTARQLISDLLLVLVDSTLPDQLLDQLPEQHQPARRVGAWLEIPYPGPHPGGGELVA